MKYSKLLTLNTLAIIFSFTLVFAQTNSKQSFVYIKDPGGILKGVIIYQPSFLNDIKINSFCVIQKLTAGNTCEYVGDTSPFAGDPTKAVKFVNQNPNLSQDAFNKIQADLQNVTSKLNDLTKPAPSNVYQDVSSAAVPEQLQGSDLNKTARTDTSVANDQNTTPTTNNPTTQPTPSPQYNIPQYTPVVLPDINALVSAAVARALAGLTLPAPQIQQVTPSQVVSSFFSGTAGGAANYVGYGASNDPNSDGSFKNLNVGSSLFVPNATISSLSAGYMAIASSSVGTATAAAMFITNSTLTNATATNSFIQNNITNNSTVTNIVMQNASTLNATVSSLFVDMATTNNSTTTNLFASNASTMNATSTNLFTVLLSSLTSIISNLIAGSATVGQEQVGTITATSSSYAPVSYASTTNASTSNSITENVTTGNINNVNSFNINATGTSQLTNVYASNTFATTSSSTNSNVRNFFANNATITAATITNSTVTNQYITNLTVSASSTIGSTTASNVSVTGNLATNIFNSIFSTISTLWGGTSNFQTSNASTSNASTSNVVNLLTTGSSTLASTTASNVSVTGNLATNVFNAIFSTIATLWGNSSNFITSNASTSNATTSNAVTANISTGNINVLNSNTINSTNINATGTSQLTNIYASTSFATTSSSTNSNVQNFFANNATISSATLTSATVTNLAVSGTFTAPGISGSAITVTNATLTNSSSTNLFATNASLTTLTSTNIFSNLLSTVFATITTLWGTTSNFQTSNASTSNATTSNAVNFLGTNATLTNATVTNLNANSLTLSVAPNGWLYTNSVGTIFASSSPTVSYITATTSTSTFLGIAAAGSIVPTADAVYDLGDPTHRFKSLYVSSTTIYIDGTALSNNSGLLTWAGSGIQAFTGSSTLGATTLSNATVTGTVYVTPFTNVGGIVFATTSGKLAQTNSFTYDQGNNKLVMTGGITSSATGTFNGIDVNSNKIINLAAPTNNTDAVNKAYVDAAFASGVLWAAPVKTISTTTAPGSPTTGDRYLLLAGQSGFGSCSNDDIAQWGGAAWVCTTPATGTTVFVDSTINQQYNYNGSAWVSIAQAIDHNTLYNLQGGQAGQYYHLNASDYNALHNGFAQLSQLETTGNPTFNSLTVTQGLSIATATLGNATATNFYSANMVISGSSTIASTTASNLTVTGNFAANTLNAITGIFSTLFSPLGYFTNLYATTTYATTSNAVTGNFTNLNATNATLTNLSVSGNIQSALTNGYVYRGSSANLSEATSSLFIANSGNVGIGITTPQSALDVNNGLMIHGTAQYATTDSGIEINKINASLGTVGMYNGPDRTERELRTYGSPTTFYTAGSERMRIDASGNVGINTTSADTALVVNGTGGIGLSTSRIRLGGGMSAGESGIGINYGLVAANTGSIQAESQGVSYRNLAINPNGGKVGIGTTAPSQTFQVAGTAAFNVGGTRGLGIQDGGSYVNLVGIDPTFLSTYNDLALSTGGSPSIYIPTNGRVGINTTAPISIFESVPTSPNPGTGIGSFGITTSGSFGGGIGLQDGAGNIGLWSSSNGAEFNVGFGSGLGALTSAIKFTAATSTWSSSGGLNITNGCYAVAGVCLTTSLPTATNNVQLYNASTVATVDTSATSYNYGSQGNTSLTYSRPYGTARRGNFLYVTSNGDSHVQIYDVSNKTKPSMIAQFDTTCTIGDIAIFGTALYLTDYTTNQLFVYDLSSNALAPTLANTVAAGTYPIGVVAGNNGYLYVADNDTNGTITIFDISNPLSPTLSTTYTLPSKNPTGLAVSGSALYVAHYDQAIVRVLNISAPTAPTNVSTLSVGTNPMGLKVNNNVLLVSNFTSNSINQFNITTPLAPVASSNASFSAGGTNPVGMAFSSDGTTLYVANNGSNNLTVFTVTSIDSSPVAGVGSVVSTTAMTTSQMSNVLYIKPSLSSGLFAAPGTTASQNYDALIVNGVVRGRGFTVDYSADLAETFPTSEGSIPAGTIVAFSDKKVLWNTVSGLKTSTSSDQTYLINEVRTATATDESVGVVSTSPGFLLGGKDGVPVAFSGRVPVLVTSENGVVKSGDKLTLSVTVPGQAMKLTEDGNMVGVAMSDDNGTGKVLMLVQNGYSKANSRKDFVINMQNSSSSTSTGSISLNFSQSIQDLINRVEDMVNEITTNIFHTNILCVGKYCVNQDQFGRIMTNAGINADDSSLQNYKASLLQTSTIQNPTSTTTTSTSTSDTNSWVTSSSTTSTSTSTTSTPTSTSSTITTPVSNTNTSTSTASSSPVI